MIWLIRTCLRSGTFFSFFSQFNSLFFYFSCFCVRYHPTTETTTPVYNHLTLYSIIKQLLFDDSIFRFDLLWRINHTYLRIPMAPCVNDLSPSDPRKLCVYSVCVDDIPDRTVNLIRKLVLFPFYCQQTTKAKKIHKNGKRETSVFLMDYLYFCAVKFFSSLSI